MKDTMGDLTVRVANLRAVAGGKTLVDGVGFDLAAGRLLAVVGASGSGKTTIGTALLGATRPGVTVSGTVEVGGIDALHSEPGKVPAAHLPQHPATVLNPVRRIGGVLTDIARVTGRAGAADRVHDAMRRVGLDSPALLRRFPHQLSGGQQQRLVLAQAFLCRARLLVADEPTTGQDPANRAQVATELRLAVANGMSVVLLSHDLDLVAEVGDEVAVLHGGAVVERGPVARVFDRPAHEYTRRLLAARPRARSAVPRPPARIHVQGRALVVKAAGTRILDGVDFHAGEGECLAIVGASGSGKTTLARCVAGLQRADAGVVEIDGAPLDVRGRRRTRAERAKVQYVFQDAHASFDEHRDVFTQIARTAVRLRGLSRGRPAAAARRTLADVGLPVETAMRRRDRLSGGQLQRAALARALTARPEVLVCDEITSGLDTVTQKGILDLFAALRRRERTTLILITHETAVADHLADRVLRLEGGRVTGDA